MPPDDAELVAAAQAGDRNALEALLVRHHDRVRAICRRLAGNAADADDATQEALLTIARRLDRYDGRAAFSTWAYRVATNACLDELRRRGRRPRPGLPEDHDAVWSAGPSAGIDVLPDRMAIDAALDQLPEEFRQAVVLRDLCDLDYAQIAEQLGVPPGTVRSRIARGRALLADLLAPGNPDGEPERPTQRPDGTAP